jgi:pimeloyl-ACP methyl ester carboxylesterase
MSGHRPFVLVHGGRHGGWCWRRVAPLLRRAGHEVYTPTLTGLGERAHLLSPEIGLDTHIADVVGVFDYEDIEDAVLVAHSYGGVVVTGAMEELHRRVGRLVLVDAHMPSSGQSILDCIGPERAAEILQLAEEHGEGWYVPTSDASWWGLDEPADIAWVNSKATPQPLKTYQDPVTAAERARAHPCTFIECSASLHPVAGAAWHRERCNHDPRMQYRVMHCSHEAMVTDPEPLAELLLEAARHP